MQKDTIPSESEAFNQAALLCSRSEHCASQIYEKLTRLGVPSEVQERVIARLVDERFIDESRFARAYALDKLRYNHWGRVKIDQMLRMLDISPADRQAALAELPEDEYLDILHRLVRQKRPSIQGRNDYECRAKLARYLVGKGFEPSLCFRVLDFSPDALRTSDCTPKII
ncbi:MAG: RecX family transcriptional regulator [Bacteroidaceae bacterium]|nr:RecX family transcriptional regulator [Bacteroidaceae bacterium]